MRFVYDSIARRFHRRKAHILPVVRISALHINDHRANAIYAARTGIRIGTVIVNAVNVKTVFIICAVQIA